MKFSPSPLGNTSSFTKGDISKNLTVLAQLYLQMYTKIQSHLLKQKDPGRHPLVQHNKDQQACSSSIPSLSYWKSGSVGLVVPNNPLSFQHQHPQVTATANCSRCPLDTKYPLMEGLWVWAFHYWAQPPTTDSPSEWKRDASDLTSDVITSKALPYQLRVLLSALQVFLQPCIDHAFWPFSPCQQLK